MSDERITDLFGNDDQEAMYQAALRVPLADKIEMAIKLIQTFENQALELSPDGYYVCFSGGKDSIVMAKLFEMAGVKYQLHYNNVTIDPPELVQFIKREYPHAIWHGTGRNMIRFMVEKGKPPPTRMVRWCCMEYKESGGTDNFWSIGVRAQESARRKGVWKTVGKHNSTGTPCICPILYWTEADVWSFITDIAKMPYCSLYDERKPNGERMWPRLGCIGCPMGSRRKQEFLRWPKYEAMWKKGINDLWFKWKDVPRRDGKMRMFANHSSAESLWDWWMEEENVNDTDQPDCQLYLW